MNREQRAAFGPLIREARRYKGIDQATLAEMTGISRRTIGSIERGDTVAQHDVLERLLQVLDIGPGPQSDPDVQAFIVMIEPLLQAVHPEKRTVLIRGFIGMTAQAIRRDEGGGSVIAMPTPDGPLSDPADELPAVADKSGLEESGDNSL